MSSQQTYPTMLLALIAAVSLQSASMAQNYQGRSALQNPFEDSDDVNPFEDGGAARWANDDPFADPRSGSVPTSRYERSSDTTLYSSRSLVDREKEARQTLAAAQSRKQRIDSLRATLNANEKKLFQQLGDAIESIKAEDLQGERLTFALLQKVVSQLLVDVGKVIEAHESFNKSAVEYAKLLKESQPYFADAQKRFLRYSREATYSDVRIRYQSLSNLAAAVTRKLAGQVTVVSPGITQVQGSLHYVKATRLYLKRFDEFLMVVPNDQSLDPTAFLENLEKYLVKFELLQRVLTDFHKAVAQETDSKEVHPTIQEA